MDTLVVLIRKYTPSYRDRLLITCQTWGINIRGGLPPYTVSIVQTNALNVTNVTIGGNDNYFSYPNSAEPDQTLLSASSGKWSSGNLFVKTFGSMQSDCSGALPATTHINDPISRSSVAANHHIVFIATFVALVSTFLLAIFVTWYIIKRRRRLGGEPFDDHDTMPKAWWEGEISLPIMAEFSPSFHENALPYLPSLLVGSDPGPSSSRTSIAHSSSEELVMTRPSRVRFDDSVVTIGESSESDSEVGSPGVSGERRPRRGILRNRVDGGCLGDPHGLEMELETNGMLPIQGVGEVVQHRDVGVRVVRESPPPYLDCYSALPSDCT
ncbi:hypothetical protein JAAARDRAFT_62839 [Jaapia argillacea MUCL 33604]|uniref:Uncharacterized protein n=1 Tax=Jaapia argillacea MUCL 33604 TaxID=933084 RepID=A0A067P7U3_9AGAM|nr:hypothetical protein JAAARDRAFT_62839 [Jaapia argillacea MUCL 33604]